ncbi:MAG: hypothetical protein ACTSQI_14995 [Candidatus Helarchaeota archaeon]
MLRKIVVFKGNQIIYRRDYGETFSWEAISPLLTSLTYFLEEIKDDVTVDILNSIFYKIAYTTNKKLNLLFVFITDIGDSDEVIAEQIQIFNTKASPVLEGN